MGTGSVLPGALKHARRVFQRRWLLLAALPVAGCIDFVEPEIPHAGTPAVLELSLFLQDDTLLTVDARATPGFDGLGFERVMTDDTLRVLGRALPPTAVTGAGTRHYALSWVVPAAAALGPIVVEAPVVAGTARPAAVRWAGIRRAGPDTLRTVAGGAVRLPVERGGGAEDPLPQARQWFLMLRGDSGVFRLSSDGLPADTTVVPAQWVPHAGAGGRVAADLLYFQTASRTGAAGDYVLAMTLNVTVRWTILVEGS